MTSSEDEDEESESESDSDSPSTRSSSPSKKRKVDSVVLTPTRAKSGRFLPTKRRHQPHSSHNKTSASARTSTSTSSSSTTTNKANVASEETLKSILDTMNRNHKATMKLFTRLLSTNTSPASAQFSFVCNTLGCSKVQYKLRHV